VHTKYKKERKKLLYFESLILREYISLTVDLHHLAGIGDMKAEEMRPSFLYLSLESYAYEDGFTNCHAF
jgi:hypothetical protein